MTTRKSRGFTLIELMMVVTILGVLSSVAVPNFMHASLRARKTEREMIVDGISRSLQTMLVRDGRFPTTPFVGAWNPAGAPGSSKHNLDAAAVGWNTLDLAIEGGLYYRYQFVGLPVGGTSTVAVNAQGDLDGDGTTANRAVLYRMSEGVLVQLSETFTPFADDSEF